MTVTQADADRLTAAAVRDEEAHGQPADPGEEAAVAAFLAPAVAEAAAREAAGTAA